MAEDLDDLLGLAAAKRDRYARWQPVFHRPAPDARDNQRGFFASIIEQDDHALLVAEDDAGTVTGFLWARLTKAPPVYDPGGPVLAIDDFCLADDAAWPTVGRGLLLAAQAWGLEAGAVLTLVVCGPHDEPKHALLTGAGLTVASEWLVAPLG